MGYDYSYSYAYDDGAAIGIVIVYLIYLLVVCVIGIVSYVLQSLGMYTIAKRRGLRRPWMAWVPIASDYLLGSVSDQYQYVVKGKNRSKRKVMLTLSIVMGVLDAAVIASLVSFFVRLVKMGMYEGYVSDSQMMQVMAPLMGMLALCLPMMGVSIALLVFHYMAMYDLYTSCTPNNNVLFLVLSIIFRVTEPFFVFFSRKKDGGMPPRRPQPQPQPMAYIPQQPQDYQTPQPEEPRCESPEEPWDNGQ